MSDLSCNILSEENIKIVSFDIFDTILFRTVENPPDVFDIVGEKAIKSGIIDSNFSPREFRSLRMASESELLKKNGETTIESIYNNILNDSLKEAEMVRLEIETEIEVSFLNPEVISLLHDIIGAGIKIILISDMYLGKKHIEELLEGLNFPLQFIDEIFVSCDYKVSKRNKGLLYDIVINKMDCKPEELLHVGDNSCSDIKNAIAKGIQVYHYDLNRKEGYFSPDFEKIFFHDTLFEMTTLRRIYFNQNKHIHDSVITELVTDITPMFIGAVNWIVNNVYESGITKIYLLMREGELFGKFLEQTDEYRNGKISLIPLYVSRRAFILPNMSLINRDTAEALFNIPLSKKVEAIFECFDLEIPAEFRDYLEVAIKELSHFIVNGIDLKTRLLNFFLSDEVLLQINGKILQAKELAWKYLQQAGCEERFITVDIGYKGTMQTAIEEILHEHGVFNNNLHLLLIGTRELAFNKRKGVNIRSLYNSNNIDEEVFDKFYHNASINLEELMMNGKKSTVGYMVSKEGRVEPVFDRKNSVSEAQIMFVRNIQEGMFEFYSLYLELTKRNTRLNNAAASYQKLIIPLLRFLLYPTQQEFQIIEKLQIETYFRQKVAETRNQNILPVKKYPFFFVEGCLRNNYMNNLMEIAIKAYKSKVKEVIIVGTGEYGKILYMLLRMCGIRVVSFVDNNEKVQGSTIDDIAVKSVSESMATKNYAISSLAHGQELFEQITNGVRGVEKIFYFRKKS